MSFVGKEGTKEDSRVAFFEHVNIYLKTVIWLINSDISILQAMLDAAREVVNKPREAFRQKYLEAERKRLEEIEAQEAKMKADLEAKCKEKEIKKKFRE